MTDQRITTTGMWTLLQDGTGRALMEGHFPVPVEIAGHWWHVPADPPAGAATGDFVPAPQPLARTFARLAARRRAADAAVLRSDRNKPS